VISVTDPYDRILGFLDRWTKITTEKKYHHAVPDSVSVETLLQLLQYAKAPRALEYEWSTKRWGVKLMLDFRNNDANFITEYEK
jgi:hypothetical protein